MVRTLNPTLETLEGRAGRIASLVDEMKGENIVIMDLRGLSDFADAFVVATMRSRTHMQATAQRLREILSAEGLKPLNPGETGGGRWALVDYSDVIVHLFDPEARDLYDLESLWGDAKRMEWRQTASA